MSWTKTRISARLRVQDVGSTFGVLTMTTRQACCSCGQLALEVTGDPVRVSVCHCTACQRRTGSAFGVQARFPQNQVEIAGRSSQYVRTGDSGQAITFHFCPSCGTTLYWQLANSPGFIVVAVGGFADRTFSTPKFSVYESRRYPWVVIDAPVECDG